MSAITDALCIPDSGRMLALAEQNNDLQLSTKRRTRFGASTFAQTQKNATRWGNPEDRPYKPVPYIDMPIGLSDREVDQFLREQRLEDLTEKIRRNILEDVDADIRPPSPPPVYDRSGNRLNTRDVRIRKTMLAEQNRLIRYMQKHVANYVPPTDWRPQKLAKKLIIPIEKYPNAPFVPVIIGARGANHKKLQELTGCRIAIRGKTMDDKYQNDEDAALPMHVHIEADHEEQIEAADKLLVPLLNPESPEFENARVVGLETLAKWNGFTVAAHERRCGICGAIGHMGFECPENSDQTFVAQVVCAICGDKGHPTQDCPQRVYQDGSEEPINPQWKEEAEKKMESDRLYEEMMSDLTGGGGIKEPTPAIASAATTNVNPMAPPAPNAAPAPANHSSFGREYGTSFGGAAVPPANTGFHMAPPPPPDPVPPANTGFHMGGPPGTDMSLRIHEDYCGFFVGRGGDAIKRLKAQTSCDISLDAFTDEAGMKKVIIRQADVNTLNAAKPLIQQAIDEAKDRKIAIAAKSSKSKGKSGGKQSGAGSAWGGSGGAAWGGAAPQNQWGGAAMNQPYVGGMQQQSVGGGQMGGQMGMGGAGMGGAGMGTTMGGQMGGMGGAGMGGMGTLPAANSAGSSQSYGANAAMQQNPQWQQQQPGYNATWQYR